MRSQIYFLLLVLSLIPLLFFIAETQAQAQPHAIVPGNKLAHNLSVPALFVFGDSTVDPGNNDFIPTLAKGNFPPYGKDFPNGIPTGRFTNGRLATDFIISYLGIKEYVPPYLDRRLSLQELRTGVSFASGGSGFDPFTPGMSHVINMPRQMDLFRQYRWRMEHLIGKTATDNLIKNAAYVVSAGTNDFVINYFTIPFRRSRYSVSAFQNFVLQKQRQFVQDLLNQGVRRIAIAGLPPMGCLPLMITFNSRTRERDCIGSFNSIAQAYNQMLKNELNATRNYLSSKGVKITYIDIYTPLIEMIRNPNTYGINQVNIGCCGWGYIEAGPLCNPKSQVCSDASKYVFFDSIHPTEKAYYILFKSLQPTIDFIAKD